MVGSRLKDVDLSGSAFGLEVATHLAAGVDGLQRLRRLKRRKVAHVVPCEPRRPLGIVEIEPLRLQRLVRRRLDDVPFRIVALQPKLLARVEIVADEFKARRLGLLALMTEKNKGTREKLE